MKFEQMNLIRPILRAIREVGYTEPTPIQQKTVPPVLLGRDVLGCAQTGTGKTAAFALPILQRTVRAEDFDAEAASRPIRALILTPTRELALQIHENFVRYGKYLPARCAVIFGGVNQNPQVEQLRAGVDILIATPGRLNDLIGQGHISLRDIRIFVLDEADRMLDMGFIHDVKKVMAKLPAERQTLLFSATMPPQVEEIADQLLTDPIHVKISPVTSTVDSVAQSVYFLAKSDKTSLLLHLLNGNGVAGALVFTRTKHGADQVARQLNKNNIKALAIHGNKSQNARQTALSRFKSGEIDVLVATDIAARGIDIVELPTVINYNVPEEPETYIHRIGRTGRAGQSGEAITFCCSDELESFRDIEKLIDRHVEEKSCEWSVVDMKPTKPEPRQPHNGRGGKQNAPAKEKAAVKQAAPEKTNTPAKKSNAPKQGNSDQQNHPAKENNAAKQTPSNQQNNLPKQNNPQKQETSAKKNNNPAKQNNSAKQDNSAKQNNPANRAKSEPAAQNTSASRRQKGKNTPAQPPRQEKSEKQSGAEVARKQDRSNSRETSRGQERRERTSMAEQTRRGERAKPSERDRARSASPDIDRRYADSGEHDGATGQQIVTNFNRSVWLEFNEPPKRPTNIWQTPVSKPAPTAQPSAEQTPTEPSREKGRGVRGRGERNRAGKKTAVMSLTEQTPTEQVSAEQMSAKQAPAADETPRTSRRRNPFRRR